MNKDTLLIIKSVAATLLALFLFNHLLLSLLLLWLYCSIKVKKIMIKTPMKDDAIFVFIMCLLGPIGLFIAALVDPDAVFGDREPLMQRLRGFFGVKSVSFRNPFVITKITKEAAE